MRDLRTLALVTGALALLAGPPWAFGQSDSSAPSRAEVKAQTRAAEKARQLTPAGDAADFRKPTKSTSTKTRGERKAETRLARKEGQLEPAGEAGDLKIQRAEAGAKSTKTRQERKAETSAARKAGALVPAGEGPGAPTK